MAEELLVVQKHLELLERRLQEAEALLALKERDVEEAIKIHQVRMAEIHLDLGMWDARLHQKETETQQAITGLVERLKTQTEVLESGFEARRQALEAEIAHLTQTRDTHLA
jgi:hypothetical protein